MVEFHRLFSAIVIGIVLVLLVFALYRRFSKERVRLRKAKRAAKTIEKNIRHKLSMYVAQCSIANKRLRANLLREISKIDFSAWRSCTCLKQDANLYVIGPFGQVHRPEITEQVMIVDGLRNVLHWLALREFSRTKNSIRWVENSFEVRSSREIVTEVLGRPFHAELWNDIDTLIRDDFPTIFQRMSLLLRVQRLEESLDD